MAKIELKDRLHPRSKILSGREDGKKAREHFDLDKLDNTQEKYEVIINEEVIRTIAPSFFLGLFSKSIKRLGEESFRKKYIFKNENGFEVIDDIKEEIEEGIDWATRERKFLV